MTTLVNIEDSELGKMPPLVAVHYQQVFDSLPSLEGKTVVITGTTSGTGLVALKTVVAKGGAVVALNRSTPRAQQALSKTEIDQNKVTHIQCDLQDFSSVKAAGQEIKQLYAEEGIYCLANNAGVMMLEDVATKDGYDVQMQTNHLSHFLLTQLLLPLLEKYSGQHGEARVVSHSSVARNYASLMGKQILAKKFFEQKGGKLDGNGTLARFKRYANTKLANAVFTYALKDQLEKAGNTTVKSVVCHPGVAKTGLEKNMKLEWSTIGQFFFKKVFMEPVSAAFLLTPIINSLYRTTRQWKMVR